MRITFLAALGLGLALAAAAGRSQEAAARDSEETFQPNWESIKTHPVPDWYLDGKFGIFIHWGVYSVPAFGSEWYPRQMYLEGSAEFKHHIATYGSQSKFGYKDFIPLFKAERYDPKAWAALFKKAGAKFVVPVAEHHDGFPMYDSGLTAWCAGKMGPKRDLIGDLAAAVRGEGLVFGVSSHRAEHWWFMNGGKKFESDVRDPKYADFYGPAAPDKTQPDVKYLEDWFSRCRELVDKYQPQLFWFDWWIEQPVFQPYLQQFASYYYNQGLRWNKGVAINYKNKSFPDGAAVLDLERGQLSDTQPLFWQTDTAISKNSWGYVRTQDYKTARSIVGDLVDIVSKNGALLLNIGPRADGTIPDKEQEILLEIGKWLSVNGEAIYGTRPWRVYGEGPTQVKEGMFTDTERSDFTGRDIRFTTKAGVLYAIILAWPGAEAVIRSLSPDLRLYSGEVAGVELLGSNEKPAWVRDEVGLRVKMPAGKPCDYAFVLKITGKADAAKK
jgi:alpha-L-fucosidase